MSPCPIYVRLRDGLLPSGADIEAKAAHALFWLVREVGKLERRERVRLTVELVALYAFARTLTAKATRSTVVQAIDDAWQLRCEGSDPWPDSDVPDDPHDGTAKHVFDVLRTAAEGEAEPPTDGEDH